MGWYKRSSSAQLTDTVRKWLIQAYQSSPDLRLVDADLDQFTPSMDDEQAISIGAQMAQTQLQLPELTTIQQGVLDHIMSRVMTKRQSPQDNSTGIPPVEPVGDGVETAPAQQDQIV
jgi:hypothetical protein